MLYVPTSAAIRMMSSFRLAWADVVHDLDNVESVTPVRGYETRERWAGARVQAYMEPGEYLGRPVRYIVGIRPRERASEPAPVQVVGYETRVSGPRVRGRGGSQWPRTWRELCQRLTRLDGISLERGGKHVIVLRDGKRISALPVTASEYRGLVNACVELRAQGVDVSR